MLNKTRRAFLETVGVDEYLEMMALVAEFDLPDGWYVAANTCTTAARAAGAKRAEPKHFAPIYGVRAPRSAEASLASIRAFGEMVKARANAT